MRYALLSVLILGTLASCSSTRVDPFFDIHATVKQHCTDPDKGIRLVIYPMDREGEK